MLRPTGSDWVRIVVWIAPARKSKPCKSSSGGSILQSAPRSYLGYLGVAFLARSLSDKKFWLIQKEALWTITTRRRSEPFGSNRARTEIRLGGILGFWIPRWSNRSVHPDLASKSMCLVGMENGSGVGSTTLKAESESVSTRGPKRIGSALS